MHHVLENSIVFLSGTRRTHVRHCLVSENRLRGSLLIRKIFKDYSKLAFSITKWLPVVFRDDVHIYNTLEERSTFLVFKRIGRDGHSALRRMWLILQFTCYFSPSDMWFAGADHNIFSDAFLQFYNKESHLGLQRCGLRRRILPTFEFSPTRPRRFSLWQYEPFGPHECCSGCSYSEPSIRRAIFDCSCAQHISGQER